MTTLLTTGLDHGVAEIVGIKQHHDLDARWGALNSRMSWAANSVVLRKDTPKAGQVLVLDVQPDAIGDHLLAEDQDATDILMAPDVRVDRRDPSSWPPRPSVLPRLAFFESSMTR